MKLKIPIVAALVSVGFGCTYSRVVRDGWEGFREFADSPASPRSGDQRLARRGPDTGWAILMQTFAGPKRHELAQRLVRQLARKGFASGLWIKDVFAQTRVYRGHYRHVSDEVAKSDLQQTRQIRVGSEHPYKNVQLVPLGLNAEAAHSWDLRRHVGRYSLQIAYYDEQFGPGFRQEVESETARLRADGDEAFFYHGPHRSHVSIGLFTDDDFVQVGNVMTYAPHVKELQKKFPYNLGNGRSAGETREDREAPGQSSFLVRVPG